MHNEINEYLTAIPPKTPPLSFSVPCRATMNGTLYAVMTDGHQAIAVEVEASDLPDESKRFADVAETIADTGQPTTLSALLALLVASLGCETCHGALEVMQDEYLTCPHCDGPVSSGRQTMQPCPCSTRIAAVECGGFPFDANRARRVLARLPNPEQRITVGNKDQAVTVRGEGWLYVLIGVRIEALGVEAKHIEFPAADQQEQIT